MHNKLKISVVFILLAAALFLCACQKTPDDEYVVNKGDDTAQEKINATALPVSPWSEATGQANFPARWEDDIKTDYKEMIISADIVTSGIGQYPVYLVRKSSYSTEDLVKIGNYLFQDITGWRKGVSPSREFLIEAMKYVSSITMSGDQLEGLNKELARTGISDEDNVSCTNVSEIPLGERGAFSVFTKTGGGSLWINNDGSIQADSNLYGVIQPKSWFRDDDPDAPKFSAEITLDEALSKAKEFFAAIGIEGFELYRSEEARCVNMYSSEVYDTGWDLRFVRTYGYYPFSASEYDASDNGAFDFNDGASDFSSAWKAETIGLYVTGSGVKSVAMYDPYENIAMLNENVQLMDFDELATKIKTLFTAAISSPYQAEGYYVIEEMILTVIPQQKKNSTDAYLMPVWVCKIGGYTSRAENGLSHFYVPGEQTFEGWLTVAFNAIDGTRVSLPRG